MQPAVEGLAADGVRYRGFLYAGLMIGDDGTPRVLEFNCRLGDPETQPILFRLESDLVRLCLDAFEGKLGDAEVEWDPRAAVGVVIASGGYPGDYEKGKIIRGLDEADGPACKVFHAGTRLADGAVVTDGGRVLCAVALGESVRRARDLAYEAVRKIRFDGAFYRSDIGRRAIEREDARRNGRRPEAERPLRRPGTVSASSPRRSRRSFSCPEACSAGTRSPRARPSDAAPCAAPTSSAARPATPEALRGACPSG